MKQKYSVIKNEAAGRLIIQEYAELDKDMMSQLYETAYDYEAILSAVKQGKNSLIMALRTNNCYPPSIYADRLAECVMELCGQTANQSLELVLEDSEILSSEVEELELIDTIDEDAEEIEELFEDDFKE
ncbi:MAG: hypothetical protein Q8P24_07580 [Desulfobacterales bacterium]|nr:hypothetical protein [Desulfobacterales bacterium]